MQKIKHISLFAGIGGIDLAFNNNDSETIWANEIDDTACKIYKFNFKNVELVKNDIRKINASNIPDFDILTAGFPCQSFSIMGKQLGFNDPRGNLFFEIIRIAKEKKPSVIFLENVKNLLIHDNGLTFSTICKSLTELGYKIKYKIMNAIEYGDIPQERERIYIVATNNFKIYNSFSFPDKIPLKNNINDIIDRKIKKDDSFYYIEDNKYFNILNTRIKDMEYIYRIDDSGIATRAWKLCPTLKANIGTYHDRVPIIRDLHGIRKLSLYEYLLLQGFPKNYKLPDLSFKSIYKSIGNTVPVPVVKRIAKNIIQSIKN